MWGSPPPEPHDLPRLYTFYGLSFLKGSSTELCAFSSLPRTYLSWSFILRMDDFQTEQKCARFTFAATTEPAFALQLVVVALVEGISYATYAETSCSDNSYFRRRLQLRLFRRFSQLSSFCHHGTSEPQTLSSYLNFSSPSSRTC